MMLCTLCLKLTLPYIKFQSLITLAFHIENLRNIVKTIAFMI